MKVIGLTGPSGAGKGMAALFFEYHNIYSVNADEVYREVVTPPSRCLFELEEKFGSRIIKEDGTLDRKELASIVFSDKSAHKTLNEITHKYVLSRCKELLDKYKDGEARAVVFDVPLLFESGFDRECDTVISVLADKETRIDRIIARDSLSLEAARARINAQMPDEFYSSRSDFVVYNNGTKDELGAQIEDIIRELGV